MTEEPDDGAPSSPGIEADAALRGERFRAVKRAVLEARGFDSAARAAYLDTLRSRDPVVAAEVESLLAQEASPIPIVVTGGPGAGIAAQLSAALGHSEPVPDSIGSYRILEQIGTGGMGIVYRALQTAPVRREVALKVVRGGMDTQRIVARFEVEAQALALMDHPSIARVYDAGVDAGGRPYFVMELVRGDPITRYCETIAASMHDRIHLFLEVCAAVQHAHQKGIIHRDLKPSNVLVERRDDEALPKVIDFGIAKILAEPSAGGMILTQHGQLVGTPEYMSPEQAGAFGGVVDTRTDVYSLGVLLYELLTGERPYRVESLTPVDIQRAVVETQPERPSARVARSPGAASIGLSTDKLRRQLTGDLDTIVLAALRKDPAQRYGSVEQLANDLQRHLHGLPVVAREHSWSYRAGKFVRRHRVGVGLGAVSALLSVAFTTAVLVQSSRLAAERNRAVAAEHRAQAEAASAAQIADFLVGLFEASDPSESRGDSVTARALLERGAARVRTELADRPEVQGRLLHVIGEVYHTLGNHTRAEELLTEALHVRRALGAEHLDTAASLQLLGTVHHDRGDYAGAVELYGEVASMRRRLLGDEHVLVAETLNTQAISLEALGRYGEAEPLYRQALAMNRTLLGERDAEVAWGTNTLGQVLFRRGAYAPAESLFREAVALCRDIHADPHPDLAAALNNLGGVLFANGQFAAAEAVWREALADYVALYRDSHPGVARGQHNLALALQGLGRRSEAESLLRQSVELQERLLGAEHPYVARNLASLGVALQDRGDLQSAEQHIRRALAIARQALGSDHPQTAAHLDALGGVLRDRGAYAAAESSYRQALAVRVAKLPAAHPDLARTRIGLAAAMLDRGDAATALDEARLGLEASRSSLPATHWQVAEARSVLGACDAGLGSTNAESLLVAGYDGLRAALPADDRRVRAAAGRLARAARAQRP